VVGAPPYEGETALVNGPAILSEEELVTPFEKAGLILVRLEKGRFNETPHYVSMYEEMGTKAPPACWISFWKRRTVAVADVSASDDGKMIIQDNRI